VQARDLDFDDGKDVAALEGKFLRCCEAWRQNGGREQSGKQDEAQEGVGEKRKDE